jgi:ferric-chelate reductase (NADPH)
MSPKRSLELAADDGSPLVFGDETCFGLARSYRGAPGGATARFVFEVGDAVHTRLVLTRLGIDDAVLIARRANGGHLHEAGEAVLAGADRHKRIVLAGKAPSIQLLKAFLKAASLDQRRVKAKAYWAPDKTGLD